MGCRLRTTGPCVPGGSHVLENWSGAEAEDEPEGTWRVETVWRPYRG